MRPAGLQTAAEAASLLSVSHSASVPHSTYQSCVPFFINMGLAQPGRPVPDVPRCDDDTKVKSVNVLQVNPGLRRSMLPFCGDWRGWAGATGGGSRSVLSRPGAPHRCGARLNSFRRQGGRCRKIALSILSFCDCTCRAGFCADHKCGRQRVASLRVGRGFVSALHAPSTGSHWLVALI